VMWLGHQIEIIPKILDPIAFFLPSAVVMALGLLLVFGSLTPPDSITELDKINVAYSWLLILLIAVELALIFYRKYPRISRKPASRIKASIFYLSLNMVTNIIGILYVIKDGVL